MNKANIYLMCVVFLIACSPIKSSSSAEVNPPATKVVYNYEENQTPATQENTINIDENSNSNEILDIGHFAQKILYQDGQIWVLKTGGDLIKISSVSPYEQEYFSVPSHTRDMIFDGQHIWILTAQPGENGIIVKFDPYKNQILEQFQVSVSPISVTYGMGFLWVSDLADRKILKLEPSTGKILSEIRLDNPSQKISFYADRLWVLDINNNRIQVYDAFDNSLLFQYPTGQSPVDIAFFNKNAWILNQGDNTLTIIPDSMPPTPNTLVINCSLGDTHCNMNQIIAGDYGIWISSSQNSQLFQVDLENASIIRKIGVDVPIDMVFGAEKLWVLNGDRSRDELGHTLTILRP